MPPTKPPASQAPVPVILDHGTEKHLEPPAAAYIPSGLYRPTGNSRHTHAPLAQRRKRERQRARLSYPYDYNKTALPSTQAVENNRQHLDEENRRLIPAIKRATRPRVSVDSFCDLVFLDSEISRQSESPGNVGRELGETLRDVLPLDDFRTTGSDWRRDLHLKETNHSGYSDRLGCPGQCLFICLEEGPMYYYAIKIPCFWPSEHKHPIAWKRDESTREIIKGSEGYGPAGIWELARECNSDVLERILKKTYGCIGSWKRCIPFFGIVGLQFVSFEFKGTADRRGCMPVFVHERGMRQIQETIRVEAKDYRTAQAWSNDGLRVCDAWGHTEKCYEGQEKYYFRCAAKEAHNANSSVKALHTLQSVLKDNLSVLLTNGEDMITAFKRQRCLHDLHGIHKIDVPKHGESFNHTRELRGLQIKFGWRFDRMKDDWRLKVFALFGAICLIWLCTVLWISTTGDGNTAMTFGSLIAACITLVWTQTSTTKKQT